MNTIIKRILAFSLSLFLIIAPTIQQANAASSWSITSAVSAGSRTIVTATKSGYRSAVNIAPSAARLSTKLLKGANWAAILYAAIQLAPDLADIDSFKPDYPNNRVKYLVPASGSATRYKIYLSDSDWYPTQESACAAYGKAIDGWHHVGSPGSIGLCYNGDKTRYKRYTADTPDFEEKYIPISQIASQVIKNAKSGHAPSKDATRDTSIEMVIGGQFDQDLMAGAVPTSDNKPLVPSVPISGNGNVTHGADVGIGDDGISGATPGEQADAAKNAADASKKAAEAAADAAKSAAEDARKAADDAQDLINSGSDQAAIDAANDRAAAAERAAADSKSASDAAIDAANDRAAAAERAAAAATTAAQAAADKSAADASAAQAAAAAAAAADKAAAQAAADDAAAAAAQAARDLAAAKEKQAAAEKAAEKAKAEAAKPFELPLFCSWAAPVCDAVEWLMKPSPDLGEDSVLDIDNDNVTPVSTDINFGGSCPANFEFNGSIFGNSINIILLDMSKYCGFLSTFVKFPVYAASSLFALYILGGRKDG